MRFDLDLSNKVTGPNPEINVDFDLVFSCNNGVIQTQVKNVKVKEYGVYPLVGKAIKNLKGVLLEACDASPYPG